MDVHGWSRRKSCIVNCLIVIVFSVPCILGFNIWSKFQPLGAGTGVLDLEDFVVSSTLLPLGSLLMLIFCCHKKGWGWSNFIKEADTGNGLKFPKVLKFYLKWILPIIIIFIFVKGYIDIFSKI
jgi:NSS family neurotransmitter:Na+ symporter